MKNYLKLAEKFETINNLKNARGILSWDNSVMMPEGASNDRASQFQAIESVCHDIINSTEVSDLLDSVEENELKDLNQWQSSNLKLMRNEWVHSTAIDKKLLKEFIYSSTECEMRWRGAKAGNDFKTYAVFFKKVLKLSREIADIKSEKLGVSKYDALLDQYDSGRRSSQIDKVFDDLLEFIPDFIPDVLEKQKSEEGFKVPPGKFSISKQKELARKLMEKIGFDFNKGRLDESLHPFCGGTSEDVRITTRYKEDEFINSLMGVLHETGHAMYELGLPRDYISQPVGQALGMTTHESQSLLMEMQVCRSKAFISFLSPLLSEYFGADDAYEIGNLYRYYNHVQPSLIRVDADEVTYPLHIIIRYQIEKKMIEGDIEVHELPFVWNDLYKKYLGLNVPSDREGCMQDIHWSDGSFGYFPTYTLGAITASQFYAKFRKDNPNIDDEIVSGNFSSLIHWLRENIHSKGSCLKADDLLYDVTGDRINSNIYKEYLKNKYL